jgi:hypothetical protein
MPTWGEFLAIAEIQGVVPVTAKTKVGGGGQVPRLIKYFRMQDGSIFICAELRVHDRLSPEYLSCLCRSLRVNPKPFGLRVEDLPIAEWP